MYNIGHFYTFAARHIDITGEQTLVPLAKKLTDYLYVVFKDYPPELGHFGFNPSQIMGLCEFYSVTGYEKAFQLAEIFVNMRGSQPNGTDQNQTRTPLRKETQAVGHAVTSNYLYAGASRCLFYNRRKGIVRCYIQNMGRSYFKENVYYWRVCPEFYGYSVNGDPISEAHGAKI